MCTKNYLRILALISLNIFSNIHSESTKHYNFRDESEQTHDAHTERRKEQERDQEAKELAQELAKQKEADQVQKSVKTIQAGLALLNNKQEKTAVAVFEIPNQSEQYILSDAQKERAKKMFEVFASHNSGPHKIIRFRYTDPNVLPETREQAIFFLYCPYIKMNLEELNNFSGRTDCPLNEAQKKIIYEKIATTKAIIARAKEEYDKSKQSKEAQSKLAAKEGLIGSTLVKTDTGHCRIEDLKVGQVVCCYDTKSGKETQSTITYFDKVRLDNHIQVIINDESIRVAPDHKFYISSSDAWIKAQDLKDNAELRQLVDPRIQDVKEVAEALEVIRISVDGKQNFFISDNNILVHNFVIEGSIMFGMGGGTAFTWAIIKPTLTAIGFGVMAYVGHKIAEKGLADAINHQQNIEERIQLFGQRMINDNNLPSDTKIETIYATATRNNNNQKKPSQAPNKNGQTPEDPKKDKEEDKTPKKITTKEAKKAADELGFKKTNYFSQGQPVFKKGNRFISPDIDSHNGGFWKMANSVKDLLSRTTRLGTYTRNLTRIGD